jgi:pimeloyl-ACP methyl ester carboxylesterase
VPPSGLGLPTQVAAARHYQPRVRDVALGRATLRIAEAGSGPPLLLVNGIGAGFQTWRPLARRLSQRHRLIMLDEPAVGGWRQLGRPLRMPGLAQLVVELCDALGESQVDVLGYSWGGALALQLARLAPQRVRRLTLASTSPGLGGQLPSPGVLALICSPWPYLSRTYLTRIAPVVYGGEWGRGTGPAQREFARWLGYSPNLIDSYLQLYAISWWTSLPWLHRITVPTLVVSGTADPLVPVQNAQLLARQIPHARLELIPGGGHLWLLEHPEASADLIGGFLAG